MTFFKRLRLGSKKQGSKNSTASHPSVERSSPKGAGTRSPANPFSNPAPAPAPARAAGIPADAPPAYTPNPTDPAAHPSYAPPAAGGPATDDPYAFLATFDTVFLIDDSGSMAGRSWRETAAALAAITPLCVARDADGIDVHFLNRADSPTFRHLATAQQVRHIFETVSPRGITPTGTRLNAILKPYLRRLQERGSEAVKPLNVIVVTDGAPSDDVESVVIGVAKALDRCDAPAWQVGLQFVQVGNEPGAREALRELDDGLVEMGCPRDIVDTVPWRGLPDGELSADKLLKVVLGSVNRRLDRRRNSGDSRRA